ncbi:hypothetical protein KUTeg_007289 [Tegillarca granosa]|uniref:Uncharacterized protein n=1 Tax=Tegillarca granosa TaxID=220873 RepID=A0ABQ9FCU3_TEGGR|nr:hypothetical protein KUTeg_007289 [Tegillarca granosa]
MKSETPDSLKKVEHIQIILHLIEQTAADGLDRSKSVEGQIKRQISNLGACQICKQMDKGIKGQIFSFKPMQFGQIWKIN